MTTFIAVGAAIVIGLIVGIVGGLYLLFKDAGESMGN